MKRFCEECGHELGPSSSFCGDCGSPVSFEKNEQHFTSGAVGDCRSENERDVIAWLEGQWLDSRRSRRPDLSGLRQGVLFTNSVVLKDLGFDPGALIRTYVTSRLKEAGVAWHVLDRACDRHSAGSVEEHLDCLKQAVGGRFQLEPRGGFPLLLFGNDEVIPMAVVDDEARRGNDGDVDTDIPYSILNADDLWRAPLESYEPYFSVGRIPIGRGFGVHALQKYLNACRSMNDSISTEGLMAVSASCWKGASADVHRELLNVGHFGGLNLSPRIAKEQLASLQPFRTHWHYFNVHGSQEEPDWQGHEGVVVCSPDFFAKQRDWNIVGVEACYGARFIGDEPADSAMLSALGNKTVAFVGASRIAYGPTDPPVAWADVLVRDFLLQAMRGGSVGKALIHARGSVLASPSLDPDMVSKTVLEFNLFGDPLVRVRNGMDISAPWSQSAWAGGLIPQVKKVSPAGGGVLQGILRMTRDNSIKIQEAVTEMLLSRYPGMKGVVPQVWTITGSPFRGAQADETLKFLYHSPSYMGRRKDVIMYCAPDGKLRQLVESK